MARKLKCAEANRLLLESVHALGRYVEAVKGLQKHSIDRKESAEFCQAALRVKAARVERDAASWHYRRHREKHGC